MPYRIILHHVCFVCPTRRNRTLPNYRKSRSAPKESKESEEELPEAIPQLERQDSSAEVKVAEVSRKPRGRAKKVVPAPAVAVVAA